MNAKQMPVAVAVVALLLAVGSAQASPIKPGLPTYSWLEDDGAGSTITAQYGPNNGTKPAAATWSTDTPFSYTGNRSIQVGDIFTGALSAPGGTLGTSGTISVWLKRDASHASDYPFAFDDSASPRTYIFARPDSSSISINGAGTLVADTSALSTGSGWHLVTVSWTPTVSTYYIDGLVKGTGTGPGAATSTGGTWYFGQRYIYSSGGYDNSWPGLMDEAAVWSTALSADNVAWLQSNSLSTIAIPEPSSLALLGLLGGAFLLRLRRRNK